MRARRAAGWTAIGVGVVLVVLLLVVLFFTWTDPGRERVRQIVLDRVEGLIDGQVTIGRVEGNLLRGIRLIDVSIRDTEGRPFVAADTIETRFGLRALLDQRIELSDLRVVGAVVVVDEPPGEEWNYVRILRLDEDDGEPGLPGWGDWVDLEDVTLVDSRVTIRSEWRPPDGLTSAQRTEALRRALAGGSRERVIEVPGGYQNVMEFRNLDAALPRMVLAHPDSAGVRFAVDEMSGLARPFTAPAARVEALAGQFRIVHDSLFMSGIRAALPDSRLAGGGVYDLSSGDLLLIARADPVAFRDLRWIYPRLPEQGGGRMTMRLELGSVVDRIYLRDMDAKVGGGTVAGRLELVTGDTLRFGDTDLRFARIETGMLERLLDFDFPRSGRLTGELAIGGPPRSLRVDGDVRFDDAAGPTSRVIAEGGLGLEPDLAFRELRLRFSPLSADLARLVVPELPLRGSIEGTAVLSGSTELLELEADLELRDPSRGLSRVYAAGGIDRRQELRLRDMDLRLDPLRLDLLRDEIPELPAGAAATGRVRLDGALAGALAVDGDIVLDDPATGVSGIGATGEIVFDDEVRFRGLRLRFDPLQAELARGWVPDLPVRGTVEGTATVTGTLASMELEADLDLRDPRYGLSRIHATGGLDTRGVVRLRDMLLRMDPLQADAIRPWVPELPPGGYFVGEVRLDGTPERLLSVDGGVAHHHDELGVSRVEARGAIGTAGPLEFRNLDVRLEPVHMALLRVFAPELPLDGTLTGTARLDGSPATFLSVRGDLVHREGGERSRVVGQADVATGPGGWATVDVRLQPLSLDVAGRFLPAAGLRGSVTGRLSASGDLGDLRVDADLTAADGGMIRAVGRMDLAEGGPGYDLDLRLRDFDLAAVSWRAPASTDLTGTVTARGQGLDPATMRATVAADLTGSEVGGVGADFVRLRAAVDAGLARVDSSRVRLGGAEALLDGSFGLVAGRDGILAYEVAIDSLHAFAPWLPGADTAVAPPRPLVPGPVIAAPTADPAPPAELLPAAPPTVTPIRTVADPAGVTREYLAADGAHVTVSTTLVQAGIERDDAAVERLLAEAAEQTAGADSLAVDEADLARDDPADTVPSDLVPPAPRVPSDSLAGSLYAAGTLRGNVTRFDADGRAVMEDLLYRGAYIGGGEAEYALADLGTSSPDVRVSADLQEVRAAGVALDSLSARGRYHGVRGEGDGALVVVAHGPDDTEYRGDLDFDLSLDRSELRIADLALRFDTITWSSTRPGVVSWADDAVEVARIELVSDAGGRVRMDGRLPVDGTGDLALVIEELEIAQAVALLQLDQQATGRLDVDARVQGTLAEPRITGTATLAEGTLDGEAVPDVRANMSYAGRELTGEAVLLDDGRRLAVADGRLPVELSFLPFPAARLLPGGLSVDVQADSLPVEAIPGLAAFLESPRGHVRGDVAVRGTTSEPVVTGAVDVNLGSVRVVPLNVQLEEVAGAFRLDGDALRVDSLVAFSGGRIVATGEIGIASLTDPTFELSIDARDALIIDTDDAKLELDGELSVGGSLAALAVTGEVRARSGVVYIPELAQMGETDVVGLHGPTRSQRIETAFQDQLRQLDEQRPLLSRLDLDIGVRVDRDVWLRSMEANVEIYTPGEVGPLRVRMAGATGDLTVEGTINTDRGEYEFMSRRFNLTRGSVSFAGGPVINPILQIAAEHEVRLPGREAFGVRVILGGTLRDPEITLETDAQPPIAQSDLLSYVAFGRDASSLLHRGGSALSGQTGDAGELAGNVAGLATQQLGTIALDALTTGIEREFMQDVGVDVFRITPADLPPDMFTGRYIDVLRSTEVEAGKYLSSRLFVAGQLNTSVSRPGVRVEYIGPFGVTWLTTWQSRWMPSEPTLTDQDPIRASVLGSFLAREWRF